MFSKEELLIILQSVNDKVISEKINSMLFVNQEIVNEIMDRFKDNGLLKIEKSNDTNEYYIHLEEDINNILDVIGYLNRIALKLKTENTWAELHPIEHENIDEMWWHGDMIQVWTREDVENKWK